MKPIRYHCGRCRALFYLRIRDPRFTMVVTTPCCRKRARVYIAEPRPITGGYR